VAPLWVEVGEAGGWGRETGLRRGVSRAQAGGPCRPVGACDVRRACAAGRTDGEGRG
jgi:hypothetical protein